MMSKEKIRHRKIEFDECDIPDRLLDFSAYINNKIQEIPEVCRAEAELEIDKYNGLIEFIITYDSPETDAEKLKRHETNKQTEQLKEVRERQELARLKELYPVD